MLISSLWPTGTAFDLLTSNLSTSDFTLLKSVKTVFNLFVSNLSITYFKLIKSTPFKNADGWNPALSSLLRFYIIRKI